MKGTISSHEGWREGAERVLRCDSDLVKAWADQADGLVTFAALFSAVVTSFIIESYTRLQADPQMITINLLRQIAAQLNRTTRPVTDVLASDTPFEPAFSDILENSALFASLICSLLAAEMGILYNEWLREYTGGLPDNPRELMHVRQYRYIGMQKWCMHGILLGMAILLQLGVAFFILAVVLFAWPLHPVVRLVVNVFVLVWIVFWIGTASCPVFSGNCPFKSPISRFIFGAVSFARRIGLGMMPRAIWDDSGAKDALEAQEQDNVVEHRDDLDTRGALAHLFNSHWGDAWLPNLDPCVEDLEAEWHGKRAREPSMRADAV